MTKDIIYYTGNRKSPEFTQRIAEKLMQNSGGVPIISVSQRPMELGKNICVGEVGHSYLNVYRQILIGAMASKAEYLIFAEDDFLYPPEYFRFVPNGEDFCRCNNTWMVLNRGPFYRTKPIGGAQVCKRSFVIRELSAYLEGQKTWFDGPEHKPEKADWNGKPFKLFNCPPVVCFKPDGNLSRSGINANGIKQRNLAPWGEVDELRRAFGI